MEPLLTDVMVDIETTGTSPDYSAIIQIGAIKFNYDTGQIGPVFNRALSIPPGRFWDESTREWWGRQNRDVFNDIVARMEDPGAVVADFHEYLTKDAPYGGFRFWAKPTHFDFSFVSSYMWQFELPMPCHFRIARDLNSFIAGLRGAPQHVDMDHVEFSGNAHNALADSIYQLKVLFAAKNGEWDAIDNADFHEVSA